MPRSARYELRAASSVCICSTVENKRRKQCTKRAGQNSLQGKESFWVTDTGNRRLVRWAMNSQTGDANVAAEGCQKQPQMGEP
eukprot:4778179-Amphidinium_carterae.1